MNRGLLRSLPASPGGAVACASGDCALIKKLAALIACLWVFCALAGAVDVPKYGVFETSFTHTGSYGNPYTGTSMTVTFTHSSGSPVMTVNGFWNGGTQWLVRFAPSATGTWNYTTSSADGGLNAKSGSFNCVTSSNKGFIKVNPSFTHSFMYADGTPFLWIGDTNWDFSQKSTSFNGTTGNFKTWVDTRATQKFTVLQGTLAPSSASGAPRYGSENEGGLMYASFSAETLNPAYFQNMDSRVQYIMGKNLILAFWLGWSDDYNNGLSGTRFEHFARYITARYGAYNVIWGVSGEYEEATTGASGIRTNGNFIKSVDPYKHLLTTHTTNTTTDDFGANPTTTNAWIDFHGQQYWESNLATVNSRIISDRSATFGSKPVVDLEFGYESEPTTGWSGSSDLVRNVMWSIMIGGGFGTYGEHQIGWDKDPSMNWTTDLTRPAAEDVQHLHNFFDAIPWWDMSPQNSLLSGGTGFLLQKSGQEYAVYLPSGGTITVNLSGVSGTFNVSWFDPRNGGFTAGSPATVVGGASRSFTAPAGSNDWVLRLSQTTVPLSGPVGQWNLDETSGTSAADASGNGNTGTLVNGPVWTAGLNGNALDLDGVNDYVNVTSSGTVNLTKNLTLAAWIRPDSATGTTRTIIGKVTDANDKQFQLSLSTTGSVQFDYEKSGNNYMLSGGLVTAGTWQHVAVTVDGSLNVKIYLNGTQVATGTAPAETTATANPITLGRAAGTYNSLYYGGLLDDARIYGSALSAGDIADLAAGASGGDLSVTVYDTANAADWSFLDNLQAGNQEYGDRVFTFSSVPAQLAGLEWLRTANDSKAYTSSPVADLQLGEAMEVYVAHNDNITSKPAWLTGWTDTGLNLVNNEVPAKTFSVYTKSYAAGATVSLGANGSTTEGMYSVALKPSALDEITVTVNDTANAADWSFQDNLQAGNQEYGDRVFTFSSVPAGLAGFEWLRTANDSKAYTGATLATLQLSSAADVYVAHNDNITPKPSWLTGWTDTGLNLINNESPAKTFSVYQKSFAAGASVPLGPNGNTMEGMYTVLLNPAP